MGISIMWDSNYAYSSRIITDMSKTEVIQVLASFDSDCFRTTDAKLNKPMVGDGLT